MLSGSVEKIANRVSLKLHQRTDRLKKVDKFFFFNEHFFEKVFGYFFLLQSFFCFQIKFAISYQPFVFYFMNILASTSVAMYIVANKSIFTL